MRKLDAAKQAAGQGTGPTPTTSRPTRELPRTGRQPAIRTPHHAPRRTY